MTVGVPARRVVAGVALVLVLPLLWLCPSGPATTAGVDARYVLTAAQRSAPADVGDLESPLLGWRVRDSEQPPDGAASQDERLRAICPTGLGQR